MSAVKVEIYTRAGCPYCVAAIGLLNSKGIAFSEYDAPSGSAGRAEMEQRVPGSRTVPQILINGQAVGGCDDLHALDRAGKLDPLLAA